MSNETIQEILQNKFETSIKEVEVLGGMLCITINAADNLKVLQYLYDEPQLGFQFLTDITGVHYPQRKGEELSVVYHVHNLVANKRLRLKLYVPGDQPDVFTATQLYSSADWMERETYDFFGINFIGHPNLSRILNADEMDYFPMLKQYPMEDPTRVDKDDEMFGRGGTVTDFKNKI